MLGCIEIMDFGVPGRRSVFSSHAPGSSPGTPEAAIVGIWSVRREYGGRFCHTSRPPYNCRCRVPCTDIYTERSRHRRFALRILIQRSKFQHLLSKGCPERIRERCIKIRRASQGHRNPHAIQPDAPEARWELRGRLDSVIPKSPS